MSPDFELEKNAWIRFFESLFNEFGDDIKVYLKGGSTLGLDLLKRCGTQSLELNLIKDWDWTIMVPNLECKNRLLRMVEKMDDFEKEGQAICVIRFRGPNGRIFIDNEALWEVSVKIGNDIYDNIPDLELPMTALCIKTTRDNIRAIMTLAEKLYYDYSEISLTELEIISAPISDDGFFEVTSVQWAGLSEFLQGVIRSVSDDIHHQQFLVSMLVEPDRGLIRLKKKNNVKARMIAKFMHDNEFEIPKYIYNEELATLLIDKMYKAIGMSPDYSSLIHSLDIDGIIEIKRILGEMKNIDNLLLGKGVTSPQKALNFQSKQIELQEKLEQIIFVINQLDEMLAGINLSTTTSRDLITRVRTVGVQKLQEDFKNFSYLVPKLEISAKCLRSLFQSLEKISAQQFVILWKAMIYLEMKK